MGQLVVRFLGGFEAVLDGRPVVGFESDKVRALLAFLVMQAGRPQRRESLTGLLWPDSPEPSARASLRNALANLRRIIGDRQAKTPFLCATRQSITFDEAGNYWLDVATFNQIVQDSAISLDVDKALLEEAISLYQGPLLDGLSVASLTFQDWLLLERERLNRQMVDALRRLALCYSDEGQLEEALNYAWRQVEMEPWEEEGQRLLIQLLAASGRRGEALAQYARCCQMLRETFDIEPSEEMMVLHHLILAGEVPAASTRPVNNLPVCLTPLIGREAEVAWVQAQLDNPHCRLLTLTGPGGIGKTHLALEATRAKLNQFPDGVFLVSLAAQPSTREILPILAQVLNVPYRGTIDLQRSLFERLRPKTLLLILDSFEYLIAAPGLASQAGSKLVISLLEEAPRLKILITSRMRLNLHGEHVLVLEGLNYPRPQAKVLPVDPDDYSAMALFLNCTQRLRPGYVPTTGELADIAHICRQVEGMPLAIILAASWMDLLAPREIAGEIERDIDFLVTESDNIPQRHRSLRVVFAHSWRLLPNSQQAIFQSLSVFRGGFTRDAAKAVACASVHDLRTFVSRSLLQRSPQERYTLHPLLRHYAAEKLAAKPKLHWDVCRQHSAIYTAYSHEWLKIFKGKHQQAAVAEMRMEINNLQVAWDWAAKNRELLSLAQGLDGLCTYYTYHGRYQEGLAACQAATRPAVKDPSPEGRRLIARLLSWQSVFRANLGHMERAISLSHRSLSILREQLLDDEESRPAKAFALLQLARQLTESDLKGAGQMAEESANMYRELTDEWGTAEALETLGQVAWLTADYQSTYEFLQECLRLRLGLGDSHGLASVLGTLGFVCFQMGDFEQAESFIHEGINLKQQLGDLAGAAESLFNLAMAMLWLGEFQEVNHLLAPAITSFNKTGAVTEAARLQALQAMAQALSGQYSEALTIAETSLSFARSNGLERETGILLWVLGFVSVATGDYVKAEGQLVESRRLLKSLGLLDILAAAQVAQGYAALGLGDLGLAGHHFAEGLQRQPIHQSSGIILLALPGIALLMARCGHLTRSVEINTLASRFPLIANSRFFDDVACHPLEELIAELPAEMVAQARARGWAAALGRTVTALLMELQILNEQHQVTPS